MDTSPIDLLNSWRFADAAGFANVTGVPSRFFAGVWYFALAVVFAILVRVGLTLLWAAEACTSCERVDPRFGKLFWARFRNNAEDPDDRDHFHPLALGFLELVAAPVFILLGYWLPIGGWLTLKTVAQWEAWKSSRHTFNRFLIGNALVLIFAGIMAYWFLEKPVSGTEGPAESVLLF